MELRSNKQQNSNTFRDVKLEYDVLQTLEDDLETCEQVSLVFLLYDDIHVAAERLKLSLLAKEGGAEVHMGLLLDWARSCSSHWIERLLEALLIIQAYSNISKLGFDLEDVKKYFCPGTSKTPFFIHPVKHALYKMCEGVQKREAQALAACITGDLTLVDTSSPELKYFELFILKLIQQKYITLGSWKPAGYPKSKNAVVLSDVTKLSKNLFSLKFQHLARCLLSAENEVNACIKEITDDAGNTQDGSDMIETCNILKQTMLCEKTTRNLPTAKSGAYPIYDEKNMGITLIIDERMFDFNERKDLPFREGSDHDSIKLQETWRSFGFTPVVYENLYKKDMIATIQNVIETKVQPEHSAFVLCILSHGERGVVYASDNEQVEIDELERLFFTSKVPLLAGKPKIIIIQACQGDSHIKAIPVEKPRPTSHSYIEADGPQLNKNKGSESNPEKSDILVCMATVTGFVSFRDTRSGSWFIQTLCDNLLAKCDEKHVVDILTEVNAQIAETRHYEKTQMSEFRACIRKFIYLKRIS